MHFGKWLIGVPLKINSHLWSNRDPEFFEFYDFDASFQENSTQGKIPAPDILLRARALSAAFGVLCCLLVFAIGYSTYNIWTGTIATALLLTNELFIRSVTRAMIDVHYNLFLLCLAASTLLFLKSNNKRRVALLSFLCGLIAGLACSVKVTGIVIGGCVFATVALYKQIVGKWQKRQIVRSLGLFSLSALFTIYILNPYFWPSINTLNVKAVVYELQLLPQDVASGEIRKDNRRERYPQLTNLARVLEFPKLFPRWKSNLEGQKILPSASWHGHRFMSFHHSLLIKYSSFFLDWLFLVIGIASCGRNLYLSFLRKEVKLLAVPFVYFWVNYLFILFFMELNWDRYYLPTVIASKIIAAIGIYEISKLTYRYIYRLNITSLLKIARTKIYGRNLSHQ